MPSYASFGLFLLTVMGTLSALSRSSPVEGAESQCDHAYVIKEVQKKCMEENEAVLDAEAEYWDTPPEHRNTEELCRHFALSVHCVAEKMLKCLNVYEKSMVQFVHSPYNCKLTKAQYKHLQQLIQKGDSSNDVNEVDVIPLTPDSPAETTPPDSAPESWTHGENGGGGVSGDKHQTGADPDKTEPTGETEAGNKGQKEGHTGSKGDSDSSSHLSSLSVWIFLLLAALSRSLPSSLAS